jgi:outer membrane receptor protein involved in Fe transport
LDKGNFYSLRKSLIYILLYILILISAATASNAATIKGNVSDFETKEQVVGAIIRIKELNISAHTNLEGVYIFKSVAQGDYTLVCQFLGYSDVEYSVHVGAGQNDIIHDFALVNTMEKIEITVTGKSGSESDLNARKSEQNADNAMNVMSSQAIELLPDITVANTLQRISGLTVERNSSGDGKYAVVRGMDKRYNYTTVNGIKIPSPDNANRFVPLDLFPNDIVERIEVMKALLPSMEADAIGGAINLQLRSAPDYLMIRGTVAGGFNSIFADNPFKTYDAKPINFQSPDQLHGHDYLASITEFPKSTLDYSDIHNPINTTANLIFGNRYLKEHKLGVLLAGSCQNIYTGSNSLFFEPSAQPAPDQATGTPNIYQNYRGNYPVFDYIHVRQYYTQQTRFGAHAKFDYIINNLNNINFYMLYVQSSQQQVRTSSDSVLAIQRNGPGSGLVETESRSILTVQTIFNSALQGNHYLAPGLKLDWSASYSIATNHQPDYSTFKTTQGVKQDSTTHQEITTPITVSSQSRKWTNNTDQDFAAYANLTYNKMFRDSSNLEIKLGGMARHKTRDNYYINYKMDPRIPNGQTGEYFTTYDNAVFYWSPSGEANGEQINTNTYTVTENVMGGYIQAKYTFFNRLQVLAGVRIETTAQNYTELTEPPASFVGLTGSKSYYDLLPGVHLKYLINKKQNLMFSYYQSITRPSFFEITPYSLPGDQFDIEGNPLLKHTTADNYDLRYGWFPKGTDQLLVGIFYKKINDPIEYGFIRTGASAQSLIPQNYGTSTNYGFELTFNKSIGNFGASGNYTYTNSSITTSKLLYYRATDPNTGGTSLKTISVNETSPLSGQAAHIGNLALYYKNTRQGLDLQISYVYTGKHIVYVSSYYGLDYWQRATGQLDFSAEKPLINGSRFT